MARIFGRRFEELSKQAELLEATKKRGTGEYGDSYSVESDALLNWKTKARHLIVSVCGNDSEHLSLFLESEEAKMFDTNYKIFLRLRAVFLAAKEDYEGGYLNTVRHLVQAEVFGSELDQAQELLEAGYHAAAAVIAGAVLETAMRELCANNGLSPGNLNKMNADLAKASVYSVLVQKQITALTHIRNSAAHGKNTDFTKDDVLNMIRDVPKILASF